MNYKRIFLIGFMGTGKSAVSQLLAEKLDWQAVDTDSFIEEQEESTITNLFATKGEDYFRQCETQALGFLSAEKDLVLSTGGGAVLKQENVEIMKKNGLIVLLKARADTIYNRVKNDTSRPLLADNMNVAHIQSMLDSRDNHYNNGAHLTIQTDNKTLGEVVDIIMNELGKV